MRTPLLSLLALLLGGLIVAGKLLTDGLTPSFMLVLGVLLVFDGFLRLAIARHH